GGGVELADAPAANGGPFPARALPGEGAVQRRRRSARGGEAQRHTAVALLDVIQRVAEDDPPRLDHGNAVRDALDLPEQVGGEEHGAALLGNRADDRAQDVTADDRVEAG